MAIGKAKLPISIATNAGDLTTATTIGSSRKTAKTVFQQQNHHPYKHKTIDHNMMQNHTNSSFVKNNGGGDHASVHHYGIDGHISPLEMVASNRVQKSDR